MLDPRTLSHAQLAAIVAEVQKILWQESQIMPDFPREMGEYWNPAKKPDDSDLEEIADVLDAADLKPPDFMPVDMAPPAAPPRVLDANELLWAARILNSMVGRIHQAWSRPHVNRVRLAEAIVDSYQGVPDFDPRDQRWTIAKR